MRRDDITVIIPNDHHETLSVACSVGSCAKPASAAKNGWSLNNTGYDAMRVSTSVESP